MLPIVLTLLALATAGAQAQTVLPTLGDAINSNANLTSISTLISLTPYSTALTDPNFKEIVFLPTNAALAPLINGGALPATAPLGQVATAILSYHIVPQDGSVANPSLDLTGNITQLPTAIANISGVTPDNTLITITAITLGDNAYYLAGAPPGVVLNASNSIAVAKGRVYLIDGVLIPISAPLAQLLGQNVTFSLYDAISNNGNFTELKQVIDADPVLTQFAQNNASSSTVFAPVDPAISQALAALGTNLSAALGSEQLRSVVLGHIVAGPATTSAEVLRDVPAGQSVSLPSLNGAIQLSNVDGMSITVAGDGNSQPLSVTVPDVMAGKSIIHGINGVILSSGGSNTSSPAPSPAAPVVLPPVPAPTPSPRSPPPAIKDYPNFLAAFNDLGLSSLTSALEVANLTSLFTNPDLNWTVLAPSNQGFSNTLRFFSNALSFAQSPSAVTLVLSYHVLLNNGSAIEVPTTQEGVTLPTLLGQANQTAEFFAGTVTNVTLTAVENATDLVYAGGQTPGGVFNVSEPYKAGQGRLYVMDGLVIPPSNVLIDETNSTTPLTTTTSVLDAINRVDELTSFASIINSNQGLMDLLSNPDLEITMFAPSNDALAAAQSTLATLSSDQIGNILSLHVLQGRPIFSLTIPDGGVSRMTALEGANVTVNNTEPDSRTSPTTSPVVTAQADGNPSPVFTLIPAKNNRTGISQLLPDIRAGKSTLYVLDGILLPGNNTTPGTPEIPPITPGMSPGAPGTSPGGVPVSPAPAPSPVPRAASKLSAPLLFTGVAALLALLL